MSISAWPAVATSWCWTSISMPEPLHGEDHLGAQVLEVVRRRDREVALLVAGLVAEVRVLVAAGVPVPLDRVDLVEGRVLVLLEADVVEDEELGLGTEVGGVGDARSSAGSASALLGDVARVAASRARR